MCLVTVYKAKADVLKVKTPTDVMCVPRFCLEALGADRGTTCHWHSTKERLRGSPEEDMGYTKE